MKKVIIVTGASSGMGREFVRQLDSFGADEIWGIALQNDMEQEIASELKTPFKYFAWDLTEDKNFDAYAELLKTSQVNVVMLVNCSGFGKFGRFDEIPLEASSNMIDLNCKGLVKMTELTIPYMSEGARILEIASVAGFQPIPYIAVYGATKSFVISYSRALNQELKSKKISVSCVCPFWTKTKFFDRAKVTKHEVVSKYVVMYEASKVVGYAIKKAMKRKEVIIPGFISRSQVRLVRLLPASWVMRIWLRQQKLNKKYKDKPFNK